MMTEKQKILLNYLCQNDISMALLYTDALSEAFNEGVEEGIKISHISEQIALKADVIKGS